MRFQKFVKPQMLFKSDTDQQDMSLKSKWSQRWYHFRNIVQPPSVMKRTFKYLLCTNPPISSRQTNTFKLFGFRIFRFWAYLMMVNSRNASCALDLISTFHSFKFIYNHISLQNSSLTRPWHLPIEINVLAWDSITMWRFWNWLTGPPPFGSWYIVLYTRNVPQYRHV